MEEVVYACPHCQAQNNSHVCPEDLMALPRPGDVMFCYYCQQVSYFTEDGMRLPTSEEEGRLAYMKGVFTLGVCTTGSPSEALIRLIRESTG